MDTTRHPRSQLHDCIHNPRVHPLPLFDLSSMSVFLSRQVSECVDQSTDAGCKRCSTLISKRRLQTCAVSREVLRMGVVISCKISRKRHIDRSERRDSPDEGVADSTLSGGHRQPADTQEACGFTGWKAEHGACSTSRLPSHSHGGVSHSLQHAQR